MQRGFKTWAEEQAVAHRAAMGLQEHDPLPAARLAQHLDLHVIGPEQIPCVTPTLLEHLLQAWSSQWSGVMLESAERRLIIHNTSHAPCRQESDIMHEIAHLLCKHPPGRIYTIPGFPFPLREYNEKHEDEANCLGRCLQISRPGLIWAVRRGMSTIQIAEHYGASEEMARFRRNTSGVDMQVTRGYARYGTRPARSNSAS